MSAELFDAVSRIARHETTARPTVAVGVVADAFDGGGSPPGHAVTVELRDAGLVLPRVPLAVGALGFATIPEPGDLVVVAFADGDHHAPVVIGRLYHSELGPPNHTSGEVVLHLPPGEQNPSFQATIRGAEPQLTLQLGADVSVEASGDAVRITAGSAAAVVESGGGGRAELSVGDATVTISGRGDIEVKTTGAFKVQANTIELQASASAKVAAPQLELN